MHKLLLIVIAACTPVFVFGQAKTVSSASMVLGKAIYTQRCQTCHQADGTGAQNMIPPLIKTEQVLGNKSQLIAIVLNGLTGEIKVNGDIYAGEMPAHKDLSDIEIAAVLTYVRNSFGNKASAVTVKDVKKVRSSLTK